MDSFAQALSNLRSVTFEKDQTEVKQAEAAAKHQQMLIERNDRTNQSMLANPGMLDSRVAALTQQFSPTSSKPRYDKFADKTTATDAAMPEDHPMAGFASSVKASLQNKLLNSEGTGKTLAELEREAVSENLNDDTILKSFEYKAKADSSFKNFFGIFGEDKSIRVPDALKADYTAWKEQTLQDQASREDLNEKYTTTQKVGIALGGVAAGLAAGTAAVFSGGASVPATAMLAGMASEALIGGAVALPAAYVGKAARESYRKSEAGTFHQGDAQDRVIGATIAGTMMALGSKSSGVKAMQAMGGIGATVGAISPDLGIDLATWAGAEAAIKGVGTKGLKAALNAGAISDDLAQKLKLNPTASNVIKNFEAAQEVKKAEMHIRAMDLEASMKEAAAKASIAAGPKTANVSEGFEGNIAVVDELNREMRYSMPGGPSAMIKDVDTRSTYAMTGRGKKRVANVPVEDVEKARASMHFSQFLDDMATDTTHAEHSAKLRALAEEEAYHDLFDNYVHQGSSTEALDRISMDGLNRAMGTGAGGEWKMLSLGNRVQIVTAEEAASASLLSRSVGQVSSADRLEAIKKPLLAAARKAIKDTPENFAVALEDAVSKAKSPYMVGGKLDLNQLQQDLQHYGFGTLHQFAQKVLSESSVGLKSPKKLAKFMEATEAIRSAANGGITKLGVAGAVGLGAYNFGENDAEAGVINADVLNAIKSSGGKIWNYSMQRFAPKVAEDLVSKIKPEYFSSITEKLGTLKTTIKELNAQKEKGFPDILASTLSPAKKSEAISAAHNTIYSYEQQIAGLEKQLTKGEYTLSDIRDIITADNPRLTWREEKELLEKIGVDTEGGAATLTGTASDNFNFGYKESSDGNLYGPGNTYSTTGIIDSAAGNTEAITAGYSGINRLTTGKNLGSLAQVSTANAELKKQTIKSLEDLADRVFKQYGKMKGTSAAEADPEGFSKLANQYQALRSYKSNLRNVDNSPIKAHKIIHDLLKENNLPTTYSPKLSGPNTRINYFNSKKPFDIQETYLMKDFGFSDTGYIDGETLWYKLGEQAKAAHFKSFSKEMLPQLDELEKSLRSKLAGVIEPLTGEDLSKTITYDVKKFNDLVQDVHENGVIDFDDIALHDLKNDLDSAFEYASKEEKVVIEKISGQLREYLRKDPSRAANDYLKELGYDSITHIGGYNTGQAAKHRVWIPLHDEMVKPFLSVQEQLVKSFNIEAAFKGAAAAAVPAAIVPLDQQGEAHGESVLNTVADYAKQGLMSVASLLGPDEADAAGLEMLTKLGKTVKVSPATAEFVKLTGDSKNIIQKVSNAKLLFKELPEGAVSKRGFRTGYLQTAPNSEHDIPKIIAGTQQVFPGQKSLTSPQFSVMTMFNNVIRGDEFKGSAAVQLAHGQSVVADEVRKSLKTFNNIIKTYGVKTSPKNSKAISQYTLPIQEAFDEVALPLRAQEVALNENRKAIKKFQDLVKGDPEAQTKYASIIAEREALNTKLTENVVKLNEQFVERQKAVTDMYKHLAARYPETRIALAAEDTVDFQKYPWLAGVIKPEEKRAVIAIKDMMNEYKDQISTVMGEDHVIAGDYIKHSRAMTPAFKKRTEELELFLDKAGLEGKEIIALTKLHSRTKYSQQMIPDITRNMGEYIPETEIRLMNSDFWKPGKQGGWDAVWKSHIVQNSPPLKAFFQQIADSAKPPEETILRNLSNHYATLESTRLLFGAVSAPLKHAMKLVGDMRTFGVTPTLKTMASSVGVAGRNFVRIQTEKLEMSGLVDKGTAAKLWQNKKDLDTFVASTINQQGMMDYLTDIERQFGKPSDNMLTSLIQYAGDKASVGIKAIETFDRTTSVLMAMKMAEKRGMTGQQAMYSVYDTILKNNFLSGQLNSNWARDPNIRALMLFQNTPFKIWERRVADAINAKRDLKTAWGIIKNVDLPKEYETLQGIGRTMKQAEVAFKQNMLSDAFTKDVFGNSTSKQLVKEMLLVGGMITGGKALDIDLTGHLLHLPFVKQDEGDVKVSISPIAQAAVKTMAGKQPAGFPDYDPEDHLPTASFLRHWYGTSGPLLMGSKLQRLSNNDIPEIYNNSKWKFLFSVPAAGYGH